MPSRNSTEPAGLPAPLVTVAVRVTRWNETDEPRAVEVGVASTVGVLADEVDGALRRSSAGTNEAV